MSDKLKGVWVDGGVWECKELSLLEKHLIQKIKDLDNDNGCVAMNKWFAEFFGISKSRVSQLMKSLKDKKMISVSLKYNGKEVIGRVIRILTGGRLLFKGGHLKINTPHSYIKDPSLIFTKDSNILLSNRIEEYKEKEEKYIKEILSLKKQLAKSKQLDQKEETKGEFLEEIKEVLLHFVNTTGKNLRNIDKLHKIAKSDKYKQILPRFKEGATVEECKSIITLKTKQWKGDKVMDSSLCIETIFRRSKFLKYLDEIDNLAPSEGGNEKKFTYPLPNFKDPDERWYYFYTRYNAYKPFLDEQLKNTVYRKRAVTQKDAEGLCFELELKFPNLLDIDFKYVPQP